MSKPCLVLDIWHAEQPGCLLKEVTLLVGVLRAAHEADGIGPIDRHVSWAVVWNESRHALEPLAGRPVDGQIIGRDLLSGDPRLVACLTQLLGDARDRVVPRDLLPLVAAWRPIARLREP